MVCQKFLFAIKQLQYSWRLYTSVFLNRVYRVPRCIWNQNQGIQLRKGIQRIYLFDWGFFLNSIKNDCKKNDSTYFLLYFPWQIKLTISRSAKATCKLRNCTFLRSLKCCSCVITHLEKRMFGIRWKTLVLELFRENRLVMPHSAGHRKFFLSPQFANPQPFFFLFIYFFICMCSF